MDNRAEIKKANNERRDTMNNIRDRGGGELDEIYMNKVYPTSRKCYII